MAPFSPTHFSQLTTQYDGLEPTRRYTDIISLPRPASALSQRRHPRMPLADRAKIFAPFAALRGYAEAIEAQNQLVLLQAEASVQASDAEFGA